MDPKEIQDNSSESESWCTWQAKLVDPSWSCDGPCQTPTVGEDFYYGVTLLCVLTQVIAVAAVVYWLLSSWRCGTRSKAVQQVRETIAAVVPCYLPNEAPIIKDTIRHLLTSMDHLDVLDIHIVYNTPHDMPIESELQAMINENHPQGRRLFIERVHGSKSKAENLNYALQKVSTEYVAIYDADHHPDSDSLALAVLHIQASGVDCVQGSTYIRHGGFLMRLLIHAEFFVSYFVLLPTIEVLVGTGFFGGSNGIWKTSSLQRLTFDKDALTEDIDFFARAMIQHGFSFAFLPTCRSGELAPSSAMAFWRQRLRWAMGWDEVTMRHSPSFCAATLSMRRRIGLYYIFVLRWFTQLSAVIIVLVSGISSVQAMLLSLTGAQKPYRTPPCTQQIQHLSFVLYLSTVAASFLQAVLHEPSLRLLVGLFLYFSCLPAFVVFNSVALVVSLIRVLSGNVGGWVVTTRFPQQVPLIDEPAPLIDEPAPRKALNQGAMFVMLFGFLIVGSSSGSVIGAFCFMRATTYTTTTPLWGWVPFGIGSTTKTITTYEFDNASITTGLCCGVGAGMILWVFVVALVKTLQMCKHKR